jgi:GT2 family glycosyltransferase
MLRTVAVREAGNLDEGYFMYCEDEDLCFRLIRDDWQMCFAPNAEIIHLGARSSCQNKFSMQSEFYKSQMRFLKLHRGVLSKLIFILSMRLVMWIKYLSAKTGIIKRDPADLKDHLDALYTACKR